MYCNAAEEIHQEVLFDKLKISVPYCKYRVVWQVGGTTKLSRSPELTADKRRDITFVENKSKLCLYFCP